MLGWRVGSGRAAAAAAAPRGLRHKAVGTEELGPTFNVFQMGCRSLQMFIHHQFKPGFIMMTLKMAALPLNAP